MTREDKKRTRSSDQLVDKDELIVIAREEVGSFLVIEVELHATGQVPHPRPTEVCDASQPLEALPQPPRPMAERLQQLRTIKELLGAHS